MADLAAVRDALKVRLETVSNLRVHDTVPTSVQPANGGCVAIIAPAPNFDGIVTMDGAEDVQLSVIVVTSRADEAGAQDRLDAILDSLYTALTNGSGSAWDFTAPGVATGYGAYNFGTGDAMVTYYGFTVPVMVAVS